ncbi:MAG: class I SAM-dependent methyltransferase [Sandaracinaceae bacterium]
MSVGFGGGDEAFAPQRVLFEDDDLLIVDKPEGVPCQAADPSWPDDLPMRLRRFLAQREGVPERDVYLGTHQRLDQATSGVLVYAKARRANRGLAEQFEGRSVAKTYVALVDGWRGGERTLRHRLAPGPGGRQEVVRGRRGREAVSHVARRDERAGGRALVEVRIETGRTHQIRAQLAAEGAPVVGDPLYGGAPAPRLFLHAEALGLRHPIGGGPIRVTAAAPPLFDAWLAGDTDPYRDAERIRAALAQAAERRFGLAARRRHPTEPTEAFRWVNEDGDGLPGLAVDVYGRFAVVQSYGGGAEARLDAIVDSVAEADGIEGVYLKHRPRQANVVDGRDERVSPSAPSRGVAAPGELAIREAGLRFGVRLGEGLSTGLFLDQRDNRRRVRELAPGARFLNLFAYTCAFTVAAGAGGARSTLSVDASGRALAWGRRNLAANGLPADEGPGHGGHRLWREDAFQALAELERRRERFDLIACDPPTYSTTRHGRWTSGRDWRRLAAGCLKVLAAGGTLLATSNDRRLDERRFRRYLHEAARDAQREVVKLKSLRVPSDFPVPAGGEPHLKGATLRVAR